MYIAKIINFIQIKLNYKSCHTLNRKIDHGKIKKKSKYTSNPIQNFKENGAHINYSLNWFRYMNAKCKQQQIFLMPLGFKLALSNHLRICGQQIYVTYIRKLNCKFSATRSQSRQFQSAYSVVYISLRSAIINLATQLVISHSRCYRDGYLPYTLLLTS